MVIADPWAVLNVHRRAMGRRAETYSLVDERRRGAPQRIYEIQIEGLEVGRARRLILRAGGRLVCEVFM